MALVVKNPPAIAGARKDVGSIPGSGRSSGEGHGNPPQYSCLENPWTEGPSGLQSIVLQELDMAEATHTQSHECFFFKLNSFNY